MLRKASIAGALILTLIGGAAALAHTLTPDRPISGATTLSFRLKGTSSYFNDVGASGPSIGDQFVSHNLLLKAGKSVGHLNAACIDTGAQLVCTIDAWVPGGQIAMTGQLLFRVLNDGGTGHFAITGGTGAFRHSHGEASLEDIGGRGGPILLLMLTP